MHLVRLYLMCLDILEKEEIVTYRKADRGLLMDIRSGRYQKADHTFTAEFYDLLNDLEKRLDYAKQKYLPAGSARFDPNRGVPDGGQREGGAG